MRSPIVLFFSFLQHIPFPCSSCNSCFFLPCSCLAIPPSLSLFLYLSFSGKFWLLLGTRKSWISRGFSTTLTRRREDDRGTIPSFKRIGAHFFHSRGQGHTFFIQEDRGTLLYFGGIRPHYLFSEGQGHDSFI
jgi:hypothetical protein